MDIDYVSGDEPFDQRSGIGCLADVNPERRRIVDRQLACAEEIDLRIRGLVGRDFGRSRRIECRTDRRWPGLTAVEILSDPAMTRLPLSWVLAIELEPVKVQLPPASAIS